MQLSLFWMETPCVVFSPNVEKMSSLLKIFGLSLAFDDICCIKYFFDFVIVRKWKYYYKRSRQTGVP